MKRNEKTNSKTNLWVLIAILCTALWGSASPAIKLGYDFFQLESTNVYGILLFAGIRFFGSGFLALILSRLITGKKPRLYKGLTVPIVALALTQTIAQYYFFYMALTIVTGSTAALISSTGTFFAVIFAVIIGIEVLTARKIIGILLGMLGIVVLNLGPDLELIFRWNGELFVLLSAGCYALANILVKRFSKDHEPIALTGYQFILGGAIISLIGYLGGGRLIWPGFGKSLILLHLMIVSSVAYGLWNMLLQRHDVSKVVIFHTLTPVFGALFSWIILAEDIWRWQILVAMLLIALGIMLINWKRQNEADN
ncbi:MAG TPA: DMT family transporter [Clostridiaceae bacterium]|nr:DMT family transporter [Clostridiaceae bacterium]